MSGLCVRIRIGIVVFFSVVLISLSFYDVFLFHFCVLLDPNVVCAKCQENYDRLQLHIGDKVCRHCSAEREDRGHDNLGKGDKGDSGN